MKKEKITEKTIDDKAEDNAPVNEDEKRQESKPKAAKITKVGSMLKEVRLSQGIKTADIAKKLCIRKMYLDAIEENNYKNLPPLPYGIGFIRSYANYLGLNGENIVELYKEEINIAEPKDMHVLEPQPEASMPGMQYIIISLLAIVLIYLGWSSLSEKNEMVDTTDTTTISEQQATDKPDDADAGLIVVEDFNFEPPAEQEITPEDKPLIQDLKSEQIKVLDQSYPETNGTAASTEEAPVPKADEKSTNQQTEEEVAATVKIPEQGVFIEVLKETWVEVKDKDKLYLSKVLQKGDTYTLPEGKGMVLSFGKYDGANVYINGVLTKVTRPNKKTNIALDPLLDANR